MKGRNRKPTILHKVQGTMTAAIARERENEAVAVGDLVDPPEHFDEERRMMWRYAVENAPANVVKKIDLGVFEAWIDSHATYRAAQRALNKESLVSLTIQGNVIQNPYLSIANKQKLIMAKLASELGFTPSSRSRVKATPNEKKPEENPFTQFQDLAVIRGGKS
jgi:P27 family predicted phage terminase small subunit